MRYPRYFVLTEEYQDQVLRTRSIQYAFVTKFRGRIHYKPRKLFTSIKHNVFEATADKYVKENKWREVKAEELVLMDLK